LIIKDAKMQVAWEWEKEKKGSLRIDVNLRSLIGCQLRVELV
jgi:hypothetical protein